MPGLGETAARLKALKEQAAAAARVAARVPAGRSIMHKTADFRPNPGALGMLSYAPDGLPPGAPLVVALHGCSQRAAAYVHAAGWLALADRYRFVLVAPEQGMTNNPNRCFNWFVPGDVARGGGEAASIAAMTRHALKAHGCDPERVFVTGLSAGGAMAAAMLAAYPDLFAAGAVVAGVPYGVADNLQSALAAMDGRRTHDAAFLAAFLRQAGPAGAKPARLAIWHGDADGTVKVSNAADIARQWTAAHGLDPAAGEAEALPGRTRTVWRSPSTGEVLVQSEVVAGLGHGTPLSTRGADALGEPAPYMLEAGVSSTLEIARFWGLGPPPGERAADAAPSSAKSPQEDAVTAASRQVASEIQSAIAKTLRATGLKR